MQESMTFVITLLSFWTPNYITVTVESTSLIFIQFYIAIKTLNLKILQEHLTISVWSVIEITWKFHYIKKLLGLLSNYFALKKILAYEYVLCLRNICPKILHFYIFTVKLISENNAKGVILYLIHITQTYITRYCRLYHNNICLTSINL